MADTRTATLTIDGQTYELPMRSPTAGPDVIDITKLYAQAGVFTHDPGFTSTSSCDSSITFIDGDKGELLHRGYPIDQLAGNPTSSRSATCSSTGNCQTPRRSRISRTRSPITR
jgi:citrate synthase